MRRTLIALALISFVPALVGVPSVAWAGTWTWPVNGPVVQGFDPPASPYGSGHRGIDIAAPVGTTVTAPAAGTVSFAGRVAGHLFITLDHGAGLESTYSWVTSVAVAKGEPVSAGDVIATTGSGHPTGSTPHLHIGVKLHDAYVDPLLYLGPVSVSSYIRLAA